MSFPWGSGNEVDHNVGIIIPVRIFPEIRFGGLYQEP